MFYLFISEDGPINPPEDPGEYSDDFDELDDEEYSDEFEDDSELNGDSLKKPMSVKLKGNGDGEEAEEEYPDDFEDDSEEEVSGYDKSIENFVP